MASGDSLGWTWTALIIIDDHVKFKQSFICSPIATGL